MPTHRFLLAVDNSPSSERELHYVAEMLSGREDIELYLIHICPDPAPDYYANGGTLVEYTAGCEEQAAAIFKRCLTTLSRAIDFQHITTASINAEGRPLSDIILDRQQEYKCNTVVLGKRGISKEQEFLFGSVSNSVVRSSHDFAVWIIS